jgi:hypothetical protein
MPSNRKPSRTPPRARDLAARRFAFYEKKNRDPEFLQVIRSNRLKHFKADVDDVARRLSLDPTSVSDQELLLRMLAHVHSRRRQSAFEPEARSRGRQWKWGTKEEHLALMRDIRKVWKNKTPLPPMRTLAELLQASFPSNLKYSIDLDTLEKQLRSLLSRDSP